MPIYLVLRNSVVEIVRFRIRSLDTSRRLLWFFPFHTDPPFTFQRRKDSVPAVKGRQYFRISGVNKHPRPPVEKAMAPTKLLSESRLNAAGQSDRTPSPGVIAKMSEDLIE